VNAMSKTVVRRCSWAESDPFLRAYHDEEWGVPEYDSRALWEKLMLDGFQAGLSWIIILRKRDAFRAAFKNFNPEAVARFGKDDIARLLKDPGIVRSRAKIEATIGGARAYLALQNEEHDFSTFILHLEDGRREADSEFRCGAHQDTTFGGDIQGTQEAWFQIRRTGDRLCLDASGRNRK
jgi:DNA-3-methyladenine glycosylase I